MNNNFVRLNGVDFEIRRNPRRKKITVGLDENGVYYVAVPTKASKKAIEASIGDKVYDFLEKTKKKRETRLTNAHKYEEGEMFYLHGEQYPLHYDMPEEEQFTQTKFCSLKLEFYDNAFHACPSMPRDIIPRIFKGLYSNLLRKRLSEIFPALCKKVGAGPSRVYIKDVKTIWGSRTSNDSITFNLRLAMVPDRLLECVVIHELCHIFEMNHSERFWALVAKHCPDYLECEAELKRDSAKYTI